MFEMNLRIETDTLGPYIRMDRPYFPFFSTINIRESGTRKYESPKCRKNL